MRGGGGWLLPASAPSAVCTRQRLVTVCMRVLHRSCWPCDALERRGKSGPDTREFTLVSCGWAHGRPGFVPVCRVCWCPVVSLVCGVCGSFVGCSFVRWFVRPPCAVLYLAAVDWAALRRRPSGRCVCVCVCVSLCSSSVEGGWVLQVTRSVGGAREREREREERERERREEERGVGAPPLRSSLDEKRNARSSGTLEGSHFLITKQDTHNTRTQHANNTNRQQTSSGGRTNGGTRSNNVGRIGRSGPRGTERPNGESIESMGTINAVIRCF